MHHVQWIEYSMNAWYDDAKTSHSTKHHQSKKLAVSWYSQCESRQCEWTKDIKNTFSKWFIQRQNSRYKQSSDWSKKIICNSTTFADWGKWSFVVVSIYEPKELLKYSRNVSRKEQSASTSKLSKLLVVGVMIERKLSNFWHCDRVLVALKIINFWMVTNCEGTRGVAVTKCKLTTVQAKEPKRVICGRCHRQMNHNHRNLPNKSHKQQAAKAIGIG